VLTADPSFDATAHLKKIAPGEIFRTWAKNTSDPRWTLSRQIPPGGARFTPGAVFRGRFHFATPALLQHCLVVVGVAMRLRHYISKQRK